MAYNNTFNMLCVFDYLRATGLPLSIEQLTVFLKIAHDPSLLIVDIARQLDVPVPTASRWVRSLLEYEKYNKHGHNLIQQVSDLKDARAKRLALTEKGKEVAGEINQLLEN